jgi:hypothetical protein
MMEIGAFDGARRPAILIPGTGDFMLERPVEQPKSREMFFSVVIFRQ